MTDQALKTPVTALGSYVLHPKRQNLSFGRITYPVLARKLQDPEASERRRALQTLTDYVWDPKRVACKDFSNIVAPVLKKLVADEVTEIRHHLANCFAVVAATPAGRHTFIVEDFCNETLKLIEDSDNDTRYAALTALQRLVLSTEGGPAIIAAGVIPILIKMRPEEPDYILEAVLDLLHTCSVINAREVLNAEGFDVVFPIFTHPNPKVRGKAATVVADLCVSNKGRNIALENDILQPLIDLLEYDNDLVQAKALSALMMITVSTRGVLKALEKDAVHKIIPFLQSENTENRFDAIKILTFMCEASEARRILQAHMQKLLFLKLDPYQEIRKAAEKLIKFASYSP